MKDPMHQTKIILKHTNPLQDTSRTHDHIRRDSAEHMCKGGVGTVLMAPYMYNPEQHKQAARVVLGMGCTSPLKTSCKKAKRTKRWRGETSLTRRRREVDAQSDERRSRPLLTGTAVRLSEAVLQV